MCANRPPYRCCGLGRVPGGEPPDPAAGSAGERGEAGGTHGPLPGPEDQPLSGHPGPGQHAQPPAGQSLVRPDIKAFTSLSNQTLH